MTTEMPQAKESTKIAVAILNTQDALGMDIDDDNRIEDDPYMSEAWRHHVITTRNNARISKFPHT